MGVNPNAYPEYPPRKPIKWFGRSPIPAAKFGCAPILIVLFILFVVWRLFPDAWHCLTNDCDPSGPAAPWSEQLAAADAEMRKISSNAVLTRIEARPAAYKEAPWNPDKAFEIRFSYVISNGLDYEVRLLDTKPSSTARTLKQTDLLNRSDYEEASANKDATQGISSLALGPRQAAERVWTLLRKQGRVEEAAFRWSWLTGENDAWLVNFQPEDFVRVFGSDEFYTMVIIVDAMTGEITARNSEGEVPLPIAPTPTP